MGKQTEREHVSCRRPVDRYFPRLYYYILLVRFYRILTDTGINSNGEQITKQIPQIISILRYSLFETFLALAFRGSVMAVSLW